MPALKSLSLQYSGYGEAIRDRHLQRAAIRYELAEYTKRLRDSTISREVYADLRHGLAVRRAALERRPPLDLGLELVDMIGRVSLFVGFDREEVAEVGKLLRALIAVPDEKIVVAGQPADAMYFIAAGEVTVLAVTGPVVLREGEFFGEMGLLSSRPRNASVARVGYSHLLVLSRRDFRKLLATRPTLRQQIEEVARQRLGEPARAGRKTEASSASSNTGDVDRSGHEKVDEHGQIDAAAQQEQHQGDDDPEAAHESVSLGDHGGRHHFGPRP